MFRKAKGRPVKLTLDDILSIVLWTCVAAVVAWAIMVHIL